MSYPLIGEDEIWNDAHRFHPVMGPLSEDTVGRVLALADPPEGARVLGLCGRRSAWMLRALELRPDMTGEVLESCVAHADDTRAEAERRGIAERLTVRVGHVAEQEFSGPYDLVLAVWAVLDALGGLKVALDFLHPLTGTEGTAVLGVGFWERPPDAQVLEVLELAPDAIADLPGTVRRFEEGGWIPHHGHVSTRQEWDDFMWACVRGLTERAHRVAAEGRKAEATGILHFAVDYRDAWLGGYRETLGFVTFVMRPTPRWAAFLAEYAVRRSDPADIVGALSARSRVLEHTEKA